MKGRFNDDEYLRRFYEIGEYPKIHNDIFYMTRYVDAENVIDLGSCTGLLSHRLSLKYDRVVGIEPNEHYIEKAIKSSKIKYYKMGISKDSLSNLKKILNENHIEAIFGRRVIPEIYETGGFSLVNNLIRVMYDSNVKYIVLEGRRPVKNPVNPFCNIQKECEAFANYYECVNTYRACAVLRRK